MQLRFVHRQDRRDGFDLQYHFAGHDDVGLETIANRTGFINDRNCDLPLEWNTCLVQFVTQALL